MYKEMEIKAILSVPCC